MDFDQWNEGTLVGPSERMFLSSSPAVNPVTVDVHKLDNDGAVEVVVCKFPKRAKLRPCRPLPSTRTPRRGRCKSIEISNAKGHVISVVLHGKSVAKSLKYKVRAKSRYDDEAVEKAQNPKTAPRNEGTSKTAPKR